MRYVDSYVLILNIFATHYSEIYIQECLPKLAFPNLTTDISRWKKKKMYLLATKNENKNKDTYLL